MNTRKNTSVAQKILSKIENRNIKYPNNKLGSVKVLGWLFVLSFWNSRLFNLIFWLTAAIFFYKGFSIEWAYVLLLFPLFSASMPVYNIVMLNKAYRAGVKQKASKGVYMNPYPKFSNQHEQFEKGYRE
ncbi:hypothetical protein [Photobacterium toruni]|uniref:hypothetical protein n=1 Tax=Photobacterium toruni TaxID=1935446 RepID=UPI00210FD057|nr:hypothetical protein [Photobacterium toruni]